MQQFAFDSEKKLITASSATKHHDYFCVECGSRMRLKAGVHRALHFFHIDEERNCRQNGKSLEHLHAQYFLQKEIPEVCLEHPFPLFPESLMWHGKRKKLFLKYNVPRFLKVNFKNGLWIIPKRGGQQSGFFMIIDITNEDFLPQNGHLKALHTTLQILMKRERGVLF